jgi:hypothetical protein
MCMLLSCVRITDRVHVWKVEKTLYKLHKSFLSRDSETFREMFQMPVGKSVEIEGLSDAKPIKLSLLVTTFKWEYLLGWLYST